MAATDLSEGLRQRRPGREAPARGRPSQLWQPVASLLLCVCFLAAGVWALKVSPQARIGPYGLIQALSPWYYVVMAGLLLSLAWTLGAKRFRPARLSAHLIVLVFLVHGAPAIIESAPRFVTAWLHAGFTDYVASAGRFLPKVDARFSWPGFFAGSALLNKAGGLQTAISLIRWWPVAINLLYLPLVYRIAREFSGSETTGWIAAALFPLANWVGQDYYSPQSVAFLLYLAFIYVLIGPLGAHEPPAWQTYLRWHGQRRVLEMGRPWLHGPWSGERPAGGANNASTVFWLVTLGVLMAAMATGHQLTPIVATITALMLVLVGRTRVRWLVAAFALITGGWICYGAVEFWSGHFSLLFGSVGSVQTNVGSAIISRLQGTSAHQFVVDARIVMAVVVWVLAALGALLWRTGGADRRGLLAGLLVPFGLLAGGSYGGVALLRVYLFGLPFATCLAAAAAVNIPRLSRRVMAFALLIVLLPLFLVARWGNEIFESVTANEVAGVQALYRMAPPGSTLVSLNAELPWRFANIPDYHYRASDLVGFALDSPLSFTAIAGGNPKGGYVIITRDQILYGWQSYGLPADWGANVEKILRGSPYFKLRYRNPDTEIFQYVPPKPRR
jgi:hypothetical protein